MAVKFRHLTKKQKKKLLYKRNRAHEMMFQFVRLRRAEDARIKGIEADARAKARKGSKKKKKKDPSDKIARVKNRLTGRKRESKERWNRFAGTSGGGGRGL